jgi:hypothetical protein
MNFLKKSARALTVALALLMATNAAHAVYCYTLVRYLWIENTGAVYVYLDIRGDYVQFCNINATWKGITPQICAAQLGLMRSAVARQASTYFYYLNADVSSCTSIPSYSNAPAPGYIMLRD